MKCGCGVSTCTGRMDVDVEGRMITYSDEKEIHGIYVKDPKALAEFINKLKKMYVSFME